MNGVNARGLSHPQGGTGVVIIISEYIIEAITGDDKRIRRFCLPILGGHIECDAIKYRGVALILPDLGCEGELFGKHAYFRWIGKECVFWACIECVVAS